MFKKQPKTVKDLCDQFTGELSTIASTQKATIETTENQIKALEVAKAKATDEYSAAQVAITNVQKMFGVNVEEE